MGIARGAGRVTSGWSLSVGGRGVATAESGCSVLGDITGISWIGEGGECGAMNNVLTSPCVVVDCDPDRQRRVGV